jgi:citrate synthase
MHMMKEIGKPEKAQAWINNALVKKKGDYGIWSQSL